MTNILERLEWAGTRVGIGFILLLILYYTFSALAYGVARSILQAIRDHRAEIKFRNANKEKQNENNRGA